MKKILLFISIISLISLHNVFAKQVNVLIAQKVAVNFLLSNGISCSENELNLIFTSTKSNQGTDKLVENNYFYVFNTNKGFIIVAADDNVSPILAYSTQGNFAVTNIPKNVQKFLEGYKSQIRYILKNNIGATSLIKADWHRLNSSITFSRIGGTQSVAPLLKTTWNQSPYYNDLCPYDNYEQERTVSGCVATAMTQVMKYWNYPSKGTGSSSYRHPKYGTLSANFSNTTYQWSAMPNRVTAANSAVATLTYHVGISVDMNYGVGSTGGSGAYVISSSSNTKNCAEYALKNYFGYKSTLKGISRNNYTDSEWMSTIKTELNAKRPVVYAGFGNGGGHCFVADGYDNNDFIHFNWGWDGAYDGYFANDALNPSGLGTGGGSGGYNDNHQAVIGVEPATNSTISKYDMSLYTAITVNPNPIIFKENFTVSASFTNKTSTTSSNFSGDFCALLFNSSDLLVDTIEVLKGKNLALNSYYTTPLLFSKSATSKITPGTYKVGMYFKPVGTSQWIPFTNGSYKNFISVDCIDNSVADLILYTKITAPASVYQNTPFLVNLDILNNSTTTFSGDLSIDIHDTDGEWISTLSEVSIPSLEPNYHYTKGINFSVKNGIPNRPGTYQLLAWYRKTNGEWIVIGNGDYANPIDLLVMAEKVNPDIYESNNSIETAKELPLSFSQNISLRNTAGSNCHVGNDYDFYKITVPNNVDYEIIAQLHDSYSSVEDSALYTLDGGFSYSIDNGKSWSDIYDSETDTNLIAKKGSTVYFWVSPYYAGETGTYLLDLNIRDVAYVGINENKIIDKLRLFPNPANDIFQIDASLYNGTIEQVKLIDLLGVEFILKNDLTSTITNYDVSYLNQGMYVVQIKTNREVISKKIRIIK